MAWHEGLTVAEAARALGYDLPAAIARLNGRSVPRQQWSSTPVPDGAVLDVQVLMAGG